MLALRFLAVLLVALAGCASPTTPGGDDSTPNGAQAQDLAMRQTWTAFQAAVAAHDAGALAALWSPDAIGESGATGEQLAGSILAQASDPDFAALVAATAAHELRADGAERTLAYELSSTDPETGDVYESAFYVIFRVDPNPGGAPRATLVDVFAAG